MTHRPLRPADDASPADWLLPRMPDFGGRVTDVVPSGFEAYVRVFHPAARDGLPVRWSDVAAENGKVMHSAAQFYGIAPSLWQRVESYPEDLHAPGLGELPDAVLGSLVEAVRPHTDPDAQCYFAVWEGYGDLANDAPRVVHPHRSYFLFTGALDDVIGSQPRHDADRPIIRPPNLMWPADNSWCLASEIDFDSTLVGGSRELVDDVIVQPGLEALEIESVESLQWDGDSVNKMPDYWPGADR